MPPKKSGFDGHPEAGKVEHNPHEKNKTCFSMPDFWFLLLWLASFIIMIVMTVHYGIVKLHHEYDVYRDEQAKKTEVFVDDLAERELNRSILGCVHVIKVFAQCGFFAGAASFVWVVLMTLMSNFVMDVILFVGVAMLAVFGALSLSQLTVDPYSGGCFGATFFVLAGATFLFGCCQRSRSSFVATSLAVACKFIRTNFMLYFVGLLMVAVAYCYTLCWTLAEFGIYYHLQPSVPNSTRVVVYIVLFAMWIWSMEVCRKVTVVTTSGTGAEWWFSQGLREPTFMAFLRAVTYDFGPICFGSLWIAPMQVLNPRYLFKYAFTYVGIYGYGLLPAGRKVKTLFAGEGATVAKNDLNVEYALLFVNLTVALCTCALSLMIIENGNSRLTAGLQPYARFLCGFMSFFLGLAISAVMTSVIDAANKLVFVLFLENPHVLEVTHNDEHNQLASAWKMIGLKERDVDEGGLV